MPSTWHLFFSFYGNYIEICLDKIEFSQSSETKNNYKNIFQFYLFSKVYNKFICSFKRLFWIIGYFLTVYVFVLLCSGLKSYLYFFKLHTPSRSVLPVYTWTWFLKLLKISCIEPNENMHIYTYIKLNLHKSDRTLKCLIQFI